MDAVRPPGVLHTPGGLTPIPSKPPGECSGRNDRKSAMDEYDDHDYCDRCNKHSVNCWCGIGRDPESEDDEVCRTPDKCVGQVARLRA